MHIDFVARKYPVLKDAVKSIKKVDNISQLYPPQEEAIKAGCLDGKNILLATPTSSGKTLIAELSALKLILEKKKKAIHLVPLKSLANEKYQEFVSKYQPIGIRVGISIGDLDSSDPWLDKYDFIVCSYEKFDALLRHEPPWLRDVGLVIIDEIHMLNDVGRGPIIEVLITMLKELDIQLIGLSATVKNCEEMAKWIEADVIKSDFRPVKLWKGVAFKEGEQTKILFDCNEAIELEGEPLISIIHDTLKNKKQVLVFVSTRKSSETLARELRQIVKAYLEKAEIAELKSISDKILNTLHQPTEQCKLIADFVRYGVAFDHAGLMSKQKNIIENSFRKGLIKVITCTPVLSHGVSLPSFRTLIRDIKRFDGGYSKFLSVSEVHQIFGRAGRSGYETRGESIIIGKSKKDALELMDKYIYGEPEAIQSKLSVEPTLRMEVLALLASGWCTTTSSLENFFSKTFFAHQYGNMFEITMRLKRILDKLEAYEFICVEKDRLYGEEFVPAFELSKEKRIHATPLGKRVSQLYIDPDSAYWIITNMKKRNEVTYLQTINMCTEMKISWLSEDEKRNIEEQMWSYERHLEIPDPGELEYEDYVRAFKITLILNDWINEKSENYIYKKYNIPPGELYRIKSIAEWLLYAGSELAKILEKKQEANIFNKLMLRMRHGVKIELLPLVTARGIGRVRARKLWKLGVKHLADIKRIKRQRLEEIVGIKLANSLLS